MRAKDMLGFDPFDSDDDGGGGAAGAAVAGSAPDDMFGGLSSTDMPLHPMLPSDETSTEDALREVEDFLGHRYMRMSQTDIEAELLTMQLENEMMERETRVLQVWKDTHEDDFVQEFGTADGDLILRRASAKPKVETTDRKASTTRRKTARTLRSKTMGSTVVPTSARAPVLLTLEQKSLIMNHHDASQHKTLETEREVASHIIADMIAIIDESTITGQQLQKKHQQIQAQFAPRRVEALTGSTRPTQAYFDNRIAEVISWIENELQHCRVNAEMASQRVQKVKAQIHRFAIEDSTRELGTLDFERLKITVESAEAALNRINQRFFTIKSTEQQITKAHARVVESMHAAEANLKQTQKDIHGREKMLSRLAKDCRLVKVHVQTEKERQQDFKIKIAKWGAPDVLDYARRKSQSQADEKRLERLRRQMEVARMQYRQVRTVWETLQPAVRYSQS